MHANHATVARSGIAAQDQAITPQDPDIGDWLAAGRLSTVPDTLPTGMENVAMSTTAARPSPFSRSGAWTWLTGGWRKPQVRVSDLLLSRQVVAALSGASPLSGFREFTVPRRMQRGGGSALRGKSIGGSVYLAPGSARGRRP